MHRIREQILGKMRPPSKGWYTHDEQIRAELDNLRKALNEARSRGMSDVVNNKYPIDPFYCMTIVCPFFLTLRDCQKCG